MSQNQTVATAKDIEYKAIDAMGILGTLYDARKSCLIKGEHIHVRGKTSHSSELPHCEIKKNCMDESFNLLQFIGIQDVLRINLLLGITKRLGIASVMNYPHRIDKYTRFLYYSCVTKTEQIDNTPEELGKSTQSSDPQFKATHIIHSIDLGIDLVAVIQLPNENNIINQIDHILQDLQRILSSNNSNISFNRINPFETMMNVTIYSNASSLTSITRISDMLYQINHMKTNGNDCHPVTYHLRSTKWMNQQYVPNNATLKVVPKDINQEIERYLLQFRTQIQYLDASFTDHMPKSLYGHIQDRIYDARQQILTIKDKYTKKTKQISDLVIAVRHNRRDISTISQKLYDNDQTMLQNSINRLFQDKHNIQRELNMDDDLEYQQSNNYKPSEHHLNENDTVNIIKSMINEDDRSKVIFNKKDLVDKQKCNYNASTDDNIKPSPQFEDINNIDYDANNRISSSIDIPQNVAQPRSSSPSTDDIINILLLGETGVGKSTFINAFVNYLSFDRLEQAQLNKPFVIIPVEFLMTIGDNFEERTVKFVDINNSKNEDFNHPGQSVTQHCKSYLFNLNDGTKLCLIDTPGFGDTRGIDQDDLNMEHILQYIDNLNHINAICFLLKPNSSRLNIFFRSCFTRLFDFLGPDIARNVTFCFTNGRSTFYSPGDTAPLIKTMIASLSINEIPFGKENTFCFDSESFRYLVAIQNAIPFNDDDKREYEMSWSVSVKESDRLINYIRMKLPIHYLKDGWKSILHAQFQILHLIRPILETMRNILRNSILWNMETINKKSIELYSTVIHRPAFLCYSCIPKTNIIGNFLIKDEYPHEVEKTCLTCPCSLDKHIQIDYLINYKLVNNSSIYHENEMTNQIRILCDASAACAYFLMYIVECSKDDPFIIGLTRMIKEEETISNQCKPNHLNLQLIKDLDKLKQKYKQQIDEIILNKDENNLELIYKWIKIINDIPMIQEQVLSIKQGQRIFNKQHQIDRIEI